MAERLFLAILLLVVGWVAYAVYRRYQFSQILVTDPILTGLNLQIPTVVYFTTPTCIPCKTRQQPALNKLQAELGTQLQIIQIDATEQPDVADRWGVLTAPTTFVLGRDGKPKSVNHGVADVPLLRKQVMDVA